jgi:metallo-beta-lactamase family protein
MKRGENPLEPLYSVADTRVALQQFVEVPYNTEIKINEEVKLLFTDAGHILGSAMVNLSLFENGQWKNVLFTGDIGRYKGSILKDPEPVRQAELILMESTYGDRKHDDSDLSSAALL